MLVQTLGTNGAWGDLLRVVATIRVSALSRVPRGRKTGELCFSRTNDGAQGMAAREGRSTRKYPRMDPGDDLWPGHSMTRTEGLRPAQKRQSGLETDRDLDGILDMGQCTARCVPVVVHR